MITRTRLWIRMLLVTMLLGTLLMPAAAAETGCDGCKRDAVLSKAAGLDKHHFTSILAEHATSPCFHLLYSGEIREPGARSKWKPPEYYFTTSYETNLKGRTKSRFSISLYFEDGELIHNWKTESERPTFTYDGHLNRMFRNRDAVFRKSVPLELTLLNDFEKQPSRCNIQPDTEELFPGQETGVKISHLVDIEGRKSRTFNRIVVQAVNGKIIGGTPLASDPELKAFQVGKEDITFTYVAPDGDNSQATEDKIMVYNSCDILREDEYPMPKTALKDKIAEKKIELTRANFAVAKITEKYEAICEGKASQTLRAKLYIVLKYSHTESCVEYYDTVSWNVRGTGSTLNGLFKKPQVEKSKKMPGKLLIFFDSKTGKATRISFPDCEYSFIFNTPYGVFRYEQIGVTDSATYVKGGDGIHEMSGSGTDEVIGPCKLKSTSKWNIQRYRNK